MATEEEVQLIFKAVNQYSAATTDLVKRLDEISKRADVAQEEAQALGETLERDLERGARSADTLGASLQNAFRAIQGALALWGAQKTITEILEFGEAGAQLINLERSFERLARRGGQSAQLLLSDIQAASASIMSEAEAMRQYIQAAMLLPEELAPRFGEAVQMAMATSGAGLGPFQQQLDSLVRGVSRLEPEILDNLSVIADWPAVYDAAAAAVGKTANELTKAEKQVIVFNEAQRQLTEKLGDLDTAAADMAGQGIAQLRAATEDYTNYVREVAAPTIDYYAERVAEALRGAIPGTSEYWDNLLADAQALVTEQGGGWGAYEARMSGLPDLEAQLRALAEAQDYTNMSAEQFSEFYTRASAVSRDFAQAVEETRQAQLHARNEQEQMINTAQRLMGGFDGIGSHASTASLGVDELTASMRELIKASDVTLLTGATEAVETARQQADDRYRAIARQRRAVEEAQLTDPRMAEHLEGLGWWEFVVDDMEEYTDQLVHGTTLTDDLWDTHNKGAAAAASSYSDLQSAMESYYSSWQSQASAMLDPTQSTDFAALEAELGMRMEAFDENARRAMAVAQRGPEAEKQWADMLGLGSREEALQYVKDFYAGALPEEAYNWDAAIAQFQQKMEGMVGQQRLEGMFQEKLSAAGLGIDSPLVMQALEGPFAGSGVDSAESFITAFSDKFDEEDWEGLATGAGKALEGGILSAAREAGSKFLDELAKAVSPAVARILAETDEFTP